MTKLMIFVVLGLPLSMVLDANRTASLQNAFPVDDVAHETQQDPCSYCADFDCFDFDNCYPIWDVPYIDQVIHVNGYRKMGIRHPNQFYCICKYCGEEFWCDDYFLKRR